MEPLRRTIEQYFRRTLTIVLFGATCAISKAQTNSYISTTDGFWDTPANWSLGVAPAISQSWIFITNDLSKTVTIDSRTSSSFANTLTISNLTITSGSGNTNTLYLENAGTAGIYALHVRNGLGIGGHILFQQQYGYGALMMTNSALEVDGSQGGQLINDGTMSLIESVLVTTGCTFNIGYTQPANVSASNCLIMAGGMTVSDGPVPATLKISGGTFTMSSSLILAFGGDFGAGEVDISDGALCLATNGVAVGDGNYSTGILSVSNSTFLAASISLGPGFRSNGTLTINSGTVDLGGALYLGSSGSGGNVALNSGLLVVTNGETNVGEFMGYGNLVVGGGLFLAREVFVSSFQAIGTLTVGGGTAILSSNLVIGSGGESEAFLYVNSGSLLITNATTAVANDPHQSGSAEVFVSGGQMRTKVMEIGMAGISASAGTVTISDGTLSASDSITLGDCASNFAGNLNLNGGQLLVTNATGTAFLDVRNGQFVVGGGTARVDRLVMTNSCGSLVHTGGVLIVGGFVLEPNGFCITSITRTGNDLRLTWNLGPGQTNALQATIGGANGRYSTNGFTNIFIVTNISSFGSVTNYLDVGGATNKPSRYYRVRLVP